MEHSGVLSSCASNSVVAFHDIEDEASSAPQGVNQPPPPPPIPNPFGFDISVLGQRCLALQEREFLDYNELQRLLRLKTGRSKAEILLKKSRNTFESFLRWTKDHYQPPTMNCFHLQLSHPLELGGDLIQMWIITAIFRGVQTLDLDFSDPLRHDEYPEGYRTYASLPEAVYQYSGNSIRSMRLSGCDMSISSLAMLRTLRKFCVERVHMSALMVAEIVSNCPNLEDLTLRKVAIISHIKFVDKRKVLKRLTVDGCRDMLGGIDIVAPAIEYLEYYGYAAPIVLHGYPSSLEEAHIDFGMQKEIHGQATLLAEILLFLQGCRVLTLCGYFTRFIALGIANQVQLSSELFLLEDLNLTKTTLETDELMGLIFLLRSYPMMETITIELGNRSFVTPLRLGNAVKDARAFLESQESRPIQCLERYVKKIEIKKFLGIEKEMVVIAFLLRKAKVLETLSLSVPSGVRVDHIRLGSQLHSMYAASPNLRIILNPSAT